MPDAARILVVDDERNIRKISKDTLEAQGYQVETAANAEEALRACEHAPFDLALLDLKLPGTMDGLGLLDEMHQRWPQMVIIMLTAYASLDSSIAAMRHGAYDYLVKPASLADIISSVERGVTKKRQEEQRTQVIARLEETLRVLKQDNTWKQVEAAVNDRFVHTPSLTIDRQKRLVVRDGEPLALTATEFDVLDYLVRHSDRVVTSSELIKAIQGYDLIEADARPIIRVHIQHLRQKLEQDPARPRYILNVRGRGYRFAG